MGLKSIPFNHSGTLPEHKQTIPSHLLFQTVEVSQDLVFFTVQSTDNIPHWILNIKFYTMPHQLSHNVFMMPPQSFHHTCPLPLVLNRWVRPDTQQVLYNLTIAMTTGIKQTRSMKQIYLVYFRLVVLYTQPQQENLVLTTRPMKNFLLCFLKFLFIFFVIISLLVSAREKESRE